MMQLKKGKTRHGGHYTDLKLSVENGIQLTPPEDRIMNVLLNVLMQNSNMDSNAPNYFQGNHALIDRKRKADGLQAPVIRMKPTILYQEYLGNTKPSGKEIRNIKTALQRLTEKRIDYRYERKRRDSRGTMLTDVIEGSEQLIKIYLYTSGMTEQELERFNNGDESVRDAKGEIIFVFNPLIIDQIDTKYTSMPNDINQRMAQAAGGAQRVTPAHNILRDYLLRDLSVKRYKVEINQERLKVILQLNKTRKKGRAEKTMRSVITTCEQINLLKKHEIKEGANGQRKYIFYINKNFK